MRFKDGHVRSYDADKLEASLALKKESGGTKVTNMTRRQLADGRTHYEGDCHYPNPKQPGQRRPRGFVRLGRFSVNLDTRPPAPPQVSVDVARQVLEVVKDDGHTILRREAFADTGLPAQYLDQLTRKHESDGTPKGSIFTDGRLQDSVRGVYTLDALSWLARYVEADTRHADQMMGRGFRARALTEAIRRALEGHPQEAPAVGIGTKSKPAPEAGGEG